MRADQASGQELDGCKGNRNADEEEDREIVQGNGFVRHHTPRY